jgi:hypothetical protein
MLPPAQTYASTAWLRGALRPHGAAARPGLSAACAG